MILHADRRDYIDKQLKRVGVKTTPFGLVLGELTKRHYLSLIYKTNLWLEGVISTDQFVSSLSNYFSFNNLVVISIVEIFKDFRNQYILKAKG